MCTARMFRVKGSQRLGPAKMAYARILKALCLFATAGVIASPQARSSEGAGPQDQHQHAMHHMHLDAHAHWQQMYDHYYGAAGAYHGMHHPHAHAYHPAMMNGQQQADAPPQGAANGPSKPSFPSEVQTHSWEAPLTPENLGQWDVAMSSSPSQEHIVLMPGAPNRTGQFWHRQAVPESSFEVQFGFSVEGMNRTGKDAGNVGSPGGFAFWYVYEPYSEIYPKTSEEQAAWNLFGYKPNPKGLGVFFKFLDKEGRTNPSISCVHNTADDRNIEDELPGPDALFYQYRNKSSPVQFKVTISNHGVTAQIRESPDSEWLTACNLENLILRPGGFIGFTSYNGDAAHPVAQDRKAGETAADQVLVHFVKVWDLEPKPNDPASFGRGFEGANNVNFNQADPYQMWQSAAHNFHEHFRIEQSLIKMLESMESQIKTLTAELRSLHDRLGGADNPDFVRSIKSDITGLTNLFKRHSQQQTSTLHSIHKTVESKSGVIKGESPEIVSQLTDISSQLEKTVAMKLAHNFVLSGGAIILLLIFAIFVWKKFNDMEKKHML